jgi:hypothetical protein
VGATTAAFAEFDSSRSVVEPILLLFPPPRFFRQEVAMIFITHWTAQPNTLRDTIARFKETGAPPPSGIKMLARWHDVAGGRGVVVLETDSAEAMLRWTNARSDLLRFETYPVVDDATAKVLFA